MTTIDPFATIHEATRQHRAMHGCGAYTYSEGSLLGVTARMARATKVIEIGTALGYTAAWLAHGAPGAHVDTVEADEVHVGLAREFLAEAGLHHRVTVHHGMADEVITALDDQAGTYDVAFFDGYTPTSRTLGGLRGLLRDGGVLVAGNLTLGADPAVLADLRDSSRWLTHELGETSLCIKVAP